MASSSPVRSLEETPQERSGVEAEIARLASELAALGALLVVLFGSRARNEAILGSDADILAVMPCPASETYAGRLARIATQIRPRIAVDLLVYTPEEFARMKAERRFISEALAEGVVLHGA